MKQRLGRGLSTPGPWFEYTRDLPCLELIRCRQLLLFETVEAAKVPVLMLIDSYRALQAFRHVTLEVW